MLASERVDAERPAGLTFTDVPKRLRPSSWRHWLDAIPLVPDPLHADEVVAAYSVSTEQFAALSVAPAIDAHWRTMVATERHHDAYVGWLSEHDLAKGEGLSLGVAVHGWRWSDFERWEESM
ncbi:hypothetical protein CH296_19770 [Rhodococcus sp. 14-2496-1d]|nr:hypothetical protein CH296_19770 [Rhodococcus sp. 14-2496-1d]